MFGTGIGRSNKLRTGRLVADGLSVPPEITTRRIVSAELSTGE